MRALQKKRQYGMLYENSHKEGA